MLFGLAASAVRARRCAARAQSEIELKPDLADVFHEARTEGTFAALVKDRMVMTDESRARTGYLPASTFKIPHALIALETGVVADVDKEVIRWDGVPNEIEEWNRDHTLRSAMRYSVVPVFQQIANRIGSERMKQFVDAFDYGNRDIGGAPLDKFWLEGNLRISALEQIAFLQRFHREDLPVSKRNLDAGQGHRPGGENRRHRHPLQDRTQSQGRQAVSRLAGGLGGARRGETRIFAMNIDIHSARRIWRSGWPCRARSSSASGRSDEAQSGEWKPVRRQIARQSKKVSAERLTTGSRSAR